MPTVYLMYELEARELESRIFMAQELMKANFDVVIFQHTALSFIASTMQPGYICLKSTSYQFDAAIKLLSGRGFNIVCWQEEGLHHFMGQEQSPVFSRNSSQFIDKYFAWHPADSVLAQLSGVSNSRIEIVGNVRFELLCGRNLRKKLGNTSKARILVLTNFDKSHLMYNFTKDPNLDQKGREFAENFWLSEKNSGYNNINLYRRFFRHMSGHTRAEISVRPYFYEKVKIHEEFNLPTDSYASISKSLENCDLLIHYGSTGGIEATVLGIPSLILASTRDGIDNRILGSSSFFDSEIEIAAEIEGLIDSERKIKSLSDNQYRNAVNSYGFDLRKSHHTSSLIAYFQDADEDFSQNYGHYIGRTVLLIKWLVTHLKYTLHRRLKRSHVIKSRPLNSTTTAEYLWDPIRDQNVEFKFAFNGKIVSLVRKKD